LVSSYPSADFLESGSKMGGTQDGREAEQIESIEHAKSLLIKAINILDEVGQKTAAAHAQFALDTLEINSFDLDRS
jgi:hypothetical protein